MLKKSKIFLLAAVLVLAFAQVALPALTAVGPTNPQNGFPLWYRSSTGQTATLSVPPAATAIPDPVIGGNAFSAQIGFGSEAMYWHSAATIDPLPAAAGGGAADLILALEAAFASGDAAPGEQIVFARVRVRIDTNIAGPYTVIYPYGTLNFTVLPADVGNRAINFTADVGIGAPGDFSGALSGAIDPFLVQAGFEASTTAFGDANTSTTVTGSPFGAAQNVFRIIGPAGFGTVETNQFVTGGERFAGTPFSVNRATFTRTAGGASVDVFVAAAPPFTPGTRIVARVRPTAGVPLTRSGTGFFGRIPFDGNLPASVIVRGTTNGALPTQFRIPLKDLVTITKAQFSVGTGALTIAATSSDGVGPVTLTATGFGALTAPGVDTAFLGITVPPANVTVTSSRGGTATVPVTILP